MDRNAATFQQMYREHGIRKLKGFGITQIILGILCALVSLAGVVMDGINIRKSCNTYYQTNTGQYHYANNCKDVDNAPLLLAFDVISLVFSGWFIMTGIFPLCINEKRQHRFNCLKRTHMICSIIGSSLFVPALTSMASVAFAKRRVGDKSGTAALPSILVALAVAEGVIAIMAASYSCCCSARRNRTVYPTVHPSSYLIGHSVVYASPTSQSQTNGTQTTQFQPQPLPDGGFMFTIVPQPFTIVQQPIQQTTTTQQTQLGTQQMNGIASQHNHLSEHLSNVEHGMDALIENVSAFTD